MVRCSCLYFGTYGIPCHGDGTKHTPLCGSGKGSKNTCLGLEKSNMITDWSWRDRSISKCSKLLLAVASPGISNTSFAVPISVPFQLNPSGFIALPTDDGESNQNTVYDAVGSFSQEIGMFSEIPEQEPISVLTNNTYTNAVSQLEMIFGKLQHHPKLASSFQAKFAILVAEFGQKLRVEHGNSNDLDGEYVSLFPKTDTAKKCKRLRSGYEQPRETERKRDNMSTASILWLQRPTTVWKSATCLYFIVQQERFHRTVVFLAYIPWCGSIFLGVRRSM